MADGVVRLEAADEPRRMSRWGIAQGEEVASQALYRKWRSQTFEEVVGQEHVTLTMRNALRDGRISHAYLLSGPRGTGKTSTARILAKAVNCLDEDQAARPCNRCAICVAITEGRQLDLIEIDAASNRGIDEIRDLREKIGFRPNEARYKVYIIDEVHMLTKEAFNALLKTLEEPPPHAIFVLATTEPDRVPETVRSRCQRFDFRRIPTAEMAEHLHEIVEAEGRSASKAALVAIARRATGSMRDAISLLDQLLSNNDGTLQMDQVEDVLGLVDPRYIGQIVDAIASHDTENGLALINRMVAEGIELGQLVDQIIGYLRGTLYLSIARSPDALDVSPEVAAEMSRQAETMTSGLLMTALREFIDARGALRDQVPGLPQLPVEMAFLRSAMSPASQTVASVAAPLAESQANTIAPANAPASAVAASAPGQAEVTEEIRGDASSRQEDSSNRANRSTASAPQGGDDADLRAKALEQWDRFLAAVGKRCGVPVQAALRSVKELDVVGGTLTMQFSHDFSRKLVREGEHTGKIEALWTELLGRPVQIRCTLRGESSDPPSATRVVAGDDEAFLSDARKLGAVVTKLDRS